MGYQENEEIYLTLSRKALQGLCKKHGLPVDHSKHELARLLVVYFTTKAALKERRTSHGFGSKLAGSKRSVEEDKKVKVSRGEWKRRVDASKNHGFSLRESASEKGGYSQIADQSGNSCHMGVHTFRKSLNATSMESMHMITGQIIGGSNQETKVQLGYVYSHSGNCDAEQNLPNTGNEKISSQSIKAAKFRSKVSGHCSNESGLASSSKIPAELSTSFQFFVNSDEGINLFVDLKSRPSDWINNLNDEVSIYQETHVDKSWTISNKIRDVRIVDKSSKPLGRVIEMYENVDLNSDSRSLALTYGCLPDGPKGHLDVGNQFASSSCMTCSLTQNTMASGSLSCAADTDASLQNPAETSIVNKITTTASDCLQDRNFRNLGTNLSIDARDPDHLNMKIDNAYCRNVGVTSMDDSLNSISNKSCFSVFEKSQDSSRTSESDGSGACPMSLVNGAVDKCLLQSDAGESVEHICEEQMR